MRQLQMLHEAGGLHIVGVGEDKFLVLRGGGLFLAQFLEAERAINKRHRHGLALTLAKHEAIAARELRRLAGGALELVHHLALGDRNVPERHGKAQFLHEQFHLDRAEADLAHEGMAAGIAALGGIAEREQEALIPPREILEAEGRSAGKLKGSRVRSRGSSPVAGAGSISPSSPRRSVTRGMGPGSAAPSARGLGLGRTGRAAGRRERRVEQAVGVIEGGAEHLAARNVLVGGGDAPFHAHAAGVHRRAVAEAGQGGAEGAHEEDRLDEIAARLLDGERGERAVIKRAFVITRSTASVSWPAIWSMPISGTDVSRAGSRRAGHGRCGWRSRHP